MMEDLLALATHPATPWLILGFAALALAAAALTSSNDALWGDMFDDEAEDWG